MMFRFCSRIDKSVLCVSWLCKRYLTKHLLNVKRLFAASSRGSRLNKLQRNATLFSPTEDSERTE
jgi:hypothetical protein